MRKSTSIFLEKFRRITLAGNYIPEIDGLRFVAIFWVVAWMHLPTMLNEHIFNGALWHSTYISAVVLEGGHGVPLFFMISGFILSLPFIKEKLQAGKKVSLKQYYLRRVTRLEPPFLVALLIAFLLIVFADGKSFSDYLPHLGASSVYMHNIVYNSSSAVLGVAWSLEVEVQFYVLAPFLCFIFLIKSKAIRRGTLMAGIVLFAVYAWYTLWKQPVILPNFLCYFLCGMLLGDLYESKHRSLMNNTSGLLAGIVVFAGLPFIISLHYPGLYMLKIVLLFLAFYLVLFNDRLKRLFSGQLISIIGGMCYSIYLLHTLIMSGVLRWLKTMPGLTGIPAVIIYALILLTAVVFISALFYKLVEQPCMKKEWWRRAPRNHT